MSANATTERDGSCNTHPRAKFGTPLRAIESGVDTWRLVRYLDQDRHLEQALSRCAQVTGSTWMAAEPVHGHRVGVLPGHRMLFMEGHPAVEGLAHPAALPAAERDLHAAMEAAGIPIGRDAGCGRMDSTVTLGMPDEGHGLALLTGLGVADVPRMKPAVYGRPPETVYWLSERAGRKLCRAYDKGLESLAAPRGHMIRLETQTRYTKDTRRTVADLHPSETFAKRFTPVAESVDGLTCATYPVVRDRVAELVVEGRITVQQGERLLGYLSLQSVQGAYAIRTRKRRRRELRQAGLVLADPMEDPVEVDLGEALDAALMAWAAAGDALDKHEEISDPPRCAACGGTGLRADELDAAGDPLSDDEREMLDSARCHTCAGTGRA